MGMTRRKFVGSVAATGAGVLASRSLGFGRSGFQGNSVSLAAGTKPNIVLIFPDEWRGDAIGTLGLLPVQTPNLDTIAKNGVFFSNCFTCGPLCMPARASMMTGQYVHEHGQWNNSPPARDPSSPSHVRRMRDEAGYRTALIGKAHLYLGHTVQEGKSILSQWGFGSADEIMDAFGLAMPENSDTSWAQWLGTEKYNQFLAYMNNYRPLYENLNPWGTPPLDMSPPPPPDPPYNGPYDLTSADHYDTYVGDTAAQWIRNYGGAKPFYLQANFPGPHYPVNSTTDFRQLFKLADMGLGIYKHPQDPLPPMVEFSGSVTCDIHDMTEQQMRQMRKIYFAYQTMVDVGIGKIVQALVDKGFDDNTWIFFCSDHGEMLGDHFLMYKMVFYESSTKVPLLIRPPKQAVAAGWVSAGLTDHLDLATSILDLGGLSPMFADRGTSLLDKVAAGPKGVGAQQGKEQVVSEIIFGTDVRQFMLRTPTHKMNVQLSTPLEPIELYDLVEDPTELTNHIQDSSYQHVRAQMLDRVNTFLSDTHYMPLSIARRHLLRR